MFITLYHSYSEQGYFTVNKNSNFSDSIITCFINGGTSIIAGFAVYSTIGHMAQKLNMSIATLNSRTAITGSMLVLLYFFPIAQL